MANMKMFHVLALGLLLDVTISPAAMAVDSGVMRPSGSTTAENFLRGIYANYRADGKGVNGTDVYETSLLALMAADQQAANGEIGYLDGDPLCDCQDFDIRDVKLAINPAGQDRLDVTVSFRNFDERRTLHLLLLRSPHGWRVFDVLSGDGSLRMALQTHLKTLKH